MFNISLELGISSIVLISTIFSIWFILKKITTIVRHGDLVTNEDPFKNIKESNSSLSKFNDKKDSNKLFTGFDGSIFEKF